MNINEQLSKSRVQASSFEDSAKKLDINWAGNAGKNFDVSNGLSKSGFSDMIGSISSKDISEIKEYADTIFFGLDTDGDGTLSAEELQVFNGNGKSLSTYDIMHALGTIDENAINSYAISELGPDEDEIELESSSYPMNDQAVITESYVTNAPATNAQPLTGNVSGIEKGAENTDFQSKYKSESQVKAFIDSFLGGNLKSYDDVINFLEKDAGMTLTEEDKAYIENTLIKNSLPFDEKMKADNLVKASGMTYKEAIDILNKQGVITTDIDSIMSKNQLSQDSGSASVKGNLTEAQVKRNAEKLHDSMHGWGTDEDKFDSVIYNDEINGVDMAKISLKYDEEHGSLLKDIRGDFSGKQEDARVEQYAMKLVEGANSGDLNSIKALAKELYSSMKGLGTCEKFVEVVMEYASDEVLADINNNFKDYTGKNKDLQKMIKGDFSFKTEDKYIDRIKDAVANAPTNSNFSSSQIENEAEKLHDSMKGWGTDEVKFEKVLYGQKSPEDLAATASKYIDKNGSLLKDILGDFSGKTEDAHVEQYATQLVNAANNGSNEAIKVLTKEMYSSMKGLGTCEKFVEVVMNNANDEVLAAINDNFKDFNKTGKSLEKMIKGDFSFKTEDRYIDRLNDAIANSK